MHSPKHVLSRVGLGCIVANILVIDRFFSEKTITWAAGVKLGLVGVAPRGECIAADEAEVRIHHGGIAVIPIFGSLLLLLLRAACRLLLATSTIKLKWSPGEHDRVAVQPLEGAATDLDLPTYEMAVFNGVFSGVRLMGCLDSLVSGANAKDVMDDTMFSGTVATMV